MVFEELRRIVVDIDIPELNRFTQLRSKIHEVMLSLLNNCLKPTNTMVKNLVVVQNSYINTYHPDFNGGGSSFAALLMNSQTPTELLRSDRLKVKSIGEDPNPKE